MVKYVWEYCYFLDSFRNSYLPLTMEIREGPQ